MPKRKKGIHLRIRRRKSDSEANDKKQKGDPEFIRTAFQEIKYVLFISISAQSLEFQHLA
jgi:hypothetical protein